LLFKKTLEKVHSVVSEGSDKLESLVSKAEGFVEQTEALVKVSDNTIKILAGFVIASMAMQTLVSYTQLRVNIKMLNILKEYKR